MIGDDQPAKIDIDKKPKTNFKLFKKIYGEVNDKQICYY